MTRFFIEAFNARDLEAADALISDEIEFRGPNGSSLRGTDAAREVLEAAKRFDVIMVRTDPEEIRHLVSDTRVLVPVRELVGKDELFRTAEFVLRDHRIVEFEAWATD